MHTLSAAITLDLEASFGPAKVQKFCASAVPGRTLDEATARQLLALTLLPTFASLPAALSSTEVGWVGAGYLSVFTQSI